MAFDYKDNPLRNVRVELPKDACREKAHLLNLVVWGMCLPCGRTMGIPEGGNVFERAETLKKLGV